MTRLTEEYFVRNAIILLIVYFWAINVSYTFLWSYAEEIDLEITKPNEYVIRFHAWREKRRECEYSIFV